MERESQNGMFSGPAISRTGLRAEHSLAQHHGSPRRFSRGTPAAIWIPSQQQEDRISDVARASFSPAAERNNGWRTDETHREDHRCTLIGLLRWKTDEYAGSPTRCSSTRLLGTRTADCDGVHRYHDGSSRMEADCASFRSAADTQRSSLSAISR